MDSCASHHTNGHANGLSTDSNNKVLTKTGRKKRLDHCQPTMSSALIEDFTDRAEDYGCHIEDVEFARAMDRRDPLRRLRNEFIFPKIQDLPGVELSVVDDPSRDCIYMSGNSLGLEPKGVQKYMETELHKWGKYGFHGYFSGDIPWTKCDEFVTEDLAKLVGAEKDEVVVMNGLSMNLHLLMISFYIPTKEGHKILIEEHTFPSDLFVIESQIRLHGYDPQDSIVQIKAKPGEHTLHSSAITSFLQQEGNCIALVLFSGIQYYTGQLFDIATITSTAHAKGCMVGFDLAHAVGNVPLHLHKWQVDFAAWCSYKVREGMSGGRKEGLEGRNEGRKDGGRNTRRKGSEEERNEGRWMGDRRKGNECVYEGRKELRRKE